MSGEVLINGLLASGGEVANLSALATIQGYRVGRSIYVDTLKCAFISHPANSTIADGYSIVDGYGVQWHRVVGSSDGYWLKQPIWYVEPINGSDENDGYASITALKTADEIQRRWGNNAIIPQAVTINVLNDIDHIFLRAIPYDNTCKLTISGKVTTVLTTTVSVFADYSHGTYGSVNPTPTILSGAGISDWTPYLGKRLRSNSIYAWTDMINPNGGGISTVSSSPWGSLDSDRVFIHTTPLVSDSLIIESLSTVNFIDIDWKGGDGYSPDPFGSSYEFIKISNFDIIKGLDIRNTLRTAAINIFGCNIRFTAFYLNNLSKSKQTSRIVNICNIQANAASVFCIFQGCLLTDCAPYLNGSGGAISGYFYCLSRGIINANNHPAFWGGTGSGFGVLVESQGFSVGSNVIRTQGYNSEIDIDGFSGIAGAGVVGVFLVNGANIRFDTTLGYNILGGSGAAEIGTSFSATLGVNGWKWSDCTSGFRLGKWKGTGTLIGGVLPITLSPALTLYFPSGSSIKVGYTTPKSGAPAIGYDTITTGGFRINNGDTSDNTSVVWWEAESAIPRTNEIMPANLT